MITKTLKLSDVRLKMDGETGRFSGYASVFGGLDSYGDTIVKGAFSDTLRENGQPKLFLEHSWAKGGALLPIGKCECEEDDYGLLMHAELTPGLSVSGDVLAAMKHGTIDGLSIGGMVKSGDYEERDGHRIIKRWAKLLDVSVVAYPADGAARIDLSSVKNIDFEALLPECDTEKDIERLLRDAGLSKGQATAVVSRVRSILKGRDAHEADHEKLTAEIVARLQRIAA